MVGDRGLLTEEALRPVVSTGSPLCALPLSKQGAADDGPLQISLLDDRDMAEITSPGYPGERLVVCRNPLLAAERKCKRDKLLAAMSKDLARIQARVHRIKQPLHGAARSARRSAGATNAPRWLRFATLTAGRARP